MLETDKWLVRLLAWIAMSVVGAALLAATCMASVGVTTLAVSWLEHSLWLGLAGMAGAIVVVLVLGTWGLPLALSRLSKIMEALESSPTRKQRATPNATLHITTKPPSA